MAIALAASGLCGATQSGRAVAGSGRAFEAAEVLFRRDPRFLGADAALSIPLGPGKTLWLFGDTFVALDDAAPSRSNSKMVRNSVAIQRGADPRAASLEFGWRRGGDGAPASFFPESGGLFYWPGHGVRSRDDGPLVLFLFRVRNTPGEGLGFAGAGTALAVIDDPDAPLAEWKPRIVDAAPSGFDALPATAVVRDGEFVVGLAIREKGAHAGALVRHPRERLERGDPSGAEWWNGNAWVPERDIGPGGPAFVMDDAGAECSIHYDERARAFVHVASYGFGASEIGVRTAPALTGPWTAPTIVYRPPESDGPRPFVYAAKAHPEIAGEDPRDLVVTYATNSFEFGDLFTEKGRRDLYWPRCVAVRIGP